MRVASDRKKKLPCVTTCSPGFRPSRTLTASPTGGPTFTGRSMKRPSPSAVGTYTTVRSPTDCTAPRGTTVTRPSDPLVKLTDTHLGSPCRWIDARVDVRHAPAEQPLRC